ncbi:hypothetical protein BH10ACI3_BH10ACI3_02730 [soil metagenome]
METVRLHLMLNYYPVIGMVIGVIFMLGGLWLRSDRVKQISLKIFFVTAVIALPAFVSGEIAGKAASYPEPNAAALTTHKESARMTIVVVEATGIAALIGLMLYRRESDLVKWFVLAVLLLSLTSSVLVGYTTHLGRQVKWAIPTSSIGKPGDIR